MNSSRSTIDSTADGQPFIEGERLIPAAPPLALTDFLEVDALQQVQDSFAAVTRLMTTIRDADGQPVTHPTDTQQQGHSARALEQLLVAEPDADGRLSAPIVVEGQQLGSITLEPKRLSETDPHALERFRQSCEHLKLDEEQVKTLLQAAERNFAPSQAAAVELLYQLAHHITRLCYQEYHAQQRVEELSALYRVSRLLAAHRDVQQVLDTAARSVTEVMQVAAASIRLLKEEADGELVPRAVCNLSDDYINKGAVRLQDSALFRAALEGEPQYVADMSRDPRVLFPEKAQQEGLVSMLCAGIRYEDKPIGVIQLFTDHQRQFSSFQVKLVNAITHLLGAAIANARLHQAREEERQTRRQIHLAADVQRRMLPGRMPHVEPFDIAARYVPSYELGGDFYDFINLDGHLGVAVGDVVGKGVAASLLMASVRASLRAYAQDLYDLDEVISRVNIALTRDTRESEFATLWYGVLDPQTRRLTYCNAGHEPAMLLRGSRVQRLAHGGMVPGIDRAQTYEKGIVHLMPGDVILLYTDGLIDAFNFDEQRFGRHRVERALREAAGQSAKQILQHVLWEQRRFVGMRQYTDDTTLVVLKVQESTNHG